MNNLELILYSNGNQYLLDIDDKTTIDITYNISDVKDVSTVKAAWSKTITLPDTKNNYLAFSAIAELNFETNTYNEPYFNINSKTKCEVYIDKVLVFNGYLQLLSIDYNNNNINYYNCVLYDATKKLSDAISGLYLTDLKLNNLSHTYSFANISKTWNSNNYSTGYYYPFIDYNNGWKYENVNKVSNSLQVSDFKPAIYVKYLWDMIFASASIAYRSTFLNSPDFTNLIMPSVYQNIPIGATYADDKKFKVSMNYTQSAIDSNITNGVNPAAATINGYASTLPGGGIWPNPGPAGGLTSSYPFGQIIDASINGSWKWTGKWCGGYFWNFPTSQSPNGSINNGECRGCPITFQDETTTYQTDNYDGNNMWDSTSYVFTNTSDTVAAIRFVGNLDIFSIYPLNNKPYYTGSNQVDPDTIRIDLYREINPKTGLTDSSWANGLGFQIPNGNGVNNWFEFYGDGSCNTPNGNITITEFDSTYQDRLAYVSTIYTLKSNYARINFYSDYLDNRYDPQNKNRFASLKKNERVRVVIRWKTFFGQFLLPNVPVDPSSSSLVTNRIAILGGKVSSNNILNRNATGTTPFMDGTPRYSIADINGDSSSDTLVYVGHQFVNGDKVYFSVLNGGTNLVAGNNYYVVNSTANTFQLSSTLGGSVIDFTTPIVSSTINTREAYFIPNTNFYTEVKSTVCPNGVVDMKNVLPDMKQTDFIDSITKMFNLYYEADKDVPSIINIEPRNIYVNSGNQKDWTSKVSLNDQISRQLLAETQNKNTYFKYNDDADYLNKKYKDKFSQPYSTYNYEITKNEYLKGSKDIKIIFAATPLVKMKPFESNANNNFIFSQIMANSSGSTTANNDNFKIAPRILYKYANGLLPLNNNLNIVIWDGSNFNTYYSYPYAGTLNNPYEPSLTLDFGTPLEIYFQPKYYSDRNLVNMYWKDSLDEISSINSYILTVKMYLNPIDIYNFRFNDVIYLNLESLGLGSGSQFFRVNKITGYNPGIYSLCEVELIKADKYSVKTISYNGGNSNANGNSANPNSPLFSNYLVGNTTTLSSNGTNQMTTAGLSLGSSNNINSNSVVNGNSNVVNVNSNGAIISGSNNTISQNATNAMILGNNSKVLAGVSNVVVFGDNIDASTSNTVITSNPIIEYFNMIDAGTDVVLDLFSDGSPINVIDAGYNTILGLDKDSMINIIDSKLDEV